MADPTTPRDENTQALYSIFCGVIAIPTAFLFGIGAFFGVMAIVLGRAGLARAGVGEGRAALAWAGIALGALAILLVFAVFVF